MGKEHVEYSYRGVPAPIWGLGLVVMGAVVMFMGVQRYRDGE
jgi:hypothetical protein